MVSLLKKNVPLYSSIITSSDSPANLKEIISSCSYGENKYNLMSGIRGNLKPVSLITGLKIHLAGRLTTQASPPRITTKSARLGSHLSLSMSAVDSADVNTENSIIKNISKINYPNHSKASSTSKNKLGAFTIKMTVNQYNR